jgi:hypothetical protein
MTARRIWLTRRIWLVVAALFFATATALVLTPDLHNSNPFWPAWLIVAPLSTFTIYLLLPRATNWPHTLLAVTVGLLVLWGLGGFAVHHRLTAGDPHNHGRADARCRENLRQIGNAILEYASQNKGRLPESLADLLDPALVTDPPEPRAFLAYGSEQTEASGATTREVVIDFVKGGHCSYVYLGKGLRLNVLGLRASDTVLVYEPLTNHRRAMPGVHVLHADLSVTFFAEREARRLIAELESGHNPPRDADADR